MRVASGIAAAAIDAARQQPRRSRHELRLPRQRPAPRAGPRRPHRASSPNRTASPRRRRHGRCGAEGAGEFAAGEWRRWTSGRPRSARNGTTAWSRCRRASREAYRRFVEGGWRALSAPVEAGGQGLPNSLSAAMMEDFSAANVAFALCPMLTVGAIEALVHHGSDELQARLSAQDRQRRMDRRR